MAMTANLQKIIGFFGKARTYDRVFDGLKVLSAEPGKLRCELEVKQEHLNNAGTMHGGMICSLVDTISSYAIATTGDNKFGVSVDLNVSFVSAAFPGDRVVIDSEVLRTGKSLAYANVNLFKEDGKLVATARHTKYLAHGNETADPDSYTK